MTINSLSGINNSQSQQNIQNTSAKLQAVIASLVSGNRITQASDDVAALSTASQLQAQTAGLKEVSNNLAQASSLTQVADGGAAVIQDALTQLQSLATQAASPIINDATRKQLNQQFQQVSAAIDQAATGTSFDDQQLLNGSLAGGNALSLDKLLTQGGDTGHVQLSIDNLSSSSLFGGQKLDISTTGGAQAALSTVGNALNSVLSARANIGSFQQTLNFAAANIDSAITNQEAAQAHLSDTDFAQASSQLSLDEVQRNAAIAVAAQGNRLSPAILQLIS